MDVPPMTVPLGLDRWSRSTTKVLPRLVFYTIRFLWACLHIRYLERRVRRLVLPVRYGSRRTWTVTLLGYLTYPSSLEVHRTGNRPSLLVMYLGCSVHRCLSTRVCEVFQFLCLIRDLRHSHGIPVSPFGGHPYRLFSFGT